MNMKYQKDFYVHQDPEKKMDLNSEFKPNT